MTLSLPAPFRVLFIAFVLVAHSPVLGQEAFRFAVFSDSRGHTALDECAADNYGVSPILEMVGDHVLEIHKSTPLGLVVFPGDMISGIFSRDAPSTAECNRLQLKRWREVMAPILARSVPIRVTIGNHEASSAHPVGKARKCGEHNWQYLPLRENFNVFSEILADMIHGTPGPISDLGLTYSFDMGGCHFAFLAAYTMFQNNSFSNETLQWLDSDLAQARERGAKLFVASHPPAFPGGGHMWNSLSFYDPSYTCDDYSGIDRRLQRDRFWNILKKHKVVAYFCGHEHNIQIQNVEGCWQVTSGGITHRTYPLNGAPDDKYRNRILYDGALQNPRATTVWPWNDGAKSLWGWCMVTVQKDGITLEVFGTDTKPTSAKDFPKLKTFVLQ